MSILKQIKGWIDAMFRGKSREVFNVESVTSQKMDAFIKKCANIYKGNPEWAKGDISTINFAKAVCSEVARLTTLAIGITIDGSARADYLQTQIDALYYNIRQWVEYGCAFGTVILKPNGECVEMYAPDRFIVTDTLGDKVTGCVFIDKAVSDDNKTYYTRLEYHRFVDDLYVITNKCFVGKAENDMHDPIAIENTVWNGLNEEVGVQDIDEPLYSVLRMPEANNIELGSPMGMPVFADAIQELMDLDIAYSRNRNEIDESRRIVLLDSDKMMPMQGAVAKDFIAKNNVAKKRMELPEYIRNVEGNGASDFYQEINPLLNTDTRLTGINALLSQIGYKVGFSNGYFVFNETTGIQTATGVEAEQQRTIQFIKDMRDSLERCLNSLIYALDKFADLYKYAPSGKYEVTYDFGDITYNVDEDRARWWSYVQANKVPAWMFFVKFEGMSEEDAKAMTEEARPKETGLFGVE